jgi:hypothetical protein
MKLKDRNKINENNFQAKILPRFLSKIFYEYININKFVFWQYKPKHQQFCILEI